MKKIVLSGVAAIALTACTGTPQPIVDYNAPYQSKWSVSIEDEPLTFCEQFPWQGDCVDGGRDDDDDRADNRDTAGPDTDDTGHGPDDGDGDPDGSGGGDGPDGGVDDDTGSDDDGSHGGDRPSKGNASANNGKGGNYDKTGHSDNGKGKGRDKK